MPPPSLQAEFNGCSASERACSGRWGELNVVSNFADEEIDGDGRTGKEKGHGRERREIKEYEKS